MDSVSNTHGMPEIASSIYAIRYRRDMAKLAKKR